jgi:hypothetical protein
MSQFPCLSTDDSESSGDDDADDVAAEDNAAAVDIQSDEEIVDCVRTHVDDEAAVLERFGRVPEVTYAVLPAGVLSLFHNSTRLTLGYNYTNLYGITGCLSFYPMAQCVGHALKGLACPVTPASSPASHGKHWHCSRRLPRGAAAPGLLAHAEVTTNIIFFNGSKT